VTAVRVWTATIDEAEIVARLLVEFRDHMGLDWPSDNAFHAGVERLLEDPNTEYLLGARDDDSPPAGVAQLRFRYGLWWAAHDCTLEDLYVAGHARGSGLGRALVEATLERARERGCRRVELDVHESNEAAVELYRSMGFQERDPVEGYRHLFMRCHLEG
jgi:ribosomal protein S18 acetylase RimI-like enzyme